MPNATQMIRQDHKKVEGLFKKFEQTQGSQSKRRLAENAMAELEVHAALEEEIFYPAVKRKSMTARRWSKRRSRNTKPSNN